MASPIFVSAPIIPATALFNCLSSYFAGRNARRASHQPSRGRPRLEKINSPRSANLSRMLDAGTSSARPIAKIPPTEVPLIGSSKTQGAGRPAPPAVPETQQYMPLCYCSFSRLDNDVTDLLPFRLFARVRRSFSAASMVAGLLGLSIRQKEPLGMLLLPSTPAENVRFNDRVRLLIMPSAVSPEAWKR